MSHGETVQTTVMRHATPPVLGIVVALPEELATLTSQKLVRGESVNITENIFVAYAGAGPRNAERAALDLIARGATHLISWGCAGALSPQLKAGDLLVAERTILEKSSDRTWSNHVRNLLAATLSVADGDLAESDRIVATSTEKRTLHEQTGAIALDMESGAVVREAHRAALPCLVIRAIADPVSMDLPRAVTESLNGQGEVELNKLLRFVLTHPSQIPGLIKLGLHFHAAQKTLKAVARRLDEIIHY